MERGEGGGEDIWMDSGIRWKLGRKEE